MNQAIFGYWNEVSKPKYWQFYKKNEQDKGMLEAAARL